MAHERYKDLAEVEQGFRTLKTGHMEIRPWYVQKEESTRTHAFGRPKRLISLGMIRMTDRAMLSCAIFGMTC